MNDASGSQPKKDPNAAVSFAALLREELQEISKLRAKRHWQDGPVTGLAEEVACNSLQQNNSAANQQSATLELQPGPQSHPDTEDGADAIFKQAHDLELVGLAFSGGGIRSATFNLGVLQGLAALKLLPMFDYLSTVSGGGYVGSWLSAWISRAGSDASIARCKQPAPGNDPEPPVHRVQDCLNPDRSTKPDHQEPKPIRFLREYSNYLTPRLGFLGADTWTAIAIYTRNLLLNQLIFFSFLSALLLLPRIAVWITDRTVHLNCLPWAPYLAPVAAFLLLLLALTIVTVNMKNLTGIKTGPDSCFKWYANLGWILALVAAPLLLAAWIASAWLWCHPQHSWPWYHWALVGVVTFSATWVLASLSNLPTVGPAAPHWSTTGAWFWSIVFSLISGGVGGLLLYVLADKFLVYNTHYVSFGIWHVVSFGTPLMVFIFLLVGSLQIGLIGLYFPDPRREWWSRLGGYLLIVSIIWAAVFSIAVYAPLGLMWLRGWLSRGLWLGWAATTLTGIFGGKSSATGDPDSHTWKDVALSITPYVFILGIAALIAWTLEVSLAPRDPAGILKLTKFLETSPTAQKVTGWIISFDYARGTGTLMQKTAASVPVNYVQAHWQIIANELDYRLAVVFIALVAVCVFLSWRVNINEFSMNLFYRNRLVRAYLGASHSDRNPNPFTGFDPRDELQLKDLRADQCYSGPFPIINSALNLVSGKDLAWQERKAESFVLTPIRCGFDTWLEQIDLKDQTAGVQPLPEIQEFGYRPTNQYGFSDIGFRLGTAMSISGAAASPNMGYHSSPSLAFLMALFNVRLGFWAGNPRHNSTWMYPGPRIGLLYLLAELFGQTDDQASYVYLSDGGHFENLGLYELIKRRCKYIIVCDADADGAYSFGDLGNAIRKCREDIGVEIELATTALSPRFPSDASTSATTAAAIGSATPNDKLSRCHWAIGTIHYKLVDPGADNGILVYLKTSITGDEPADVLNYRCQHPDFPHQSTADQWFAESQFESYRCLGQHTIQKLFEPITGKMKDFHIVPVQSKRTSEIFKALHDCPPAESHDEH
jgi:Patatin-like phospholipase